MSAPPYQSRGEENDIRYASTPSPYTVDKHSDVMSTLAKTFQEKDKEKGKRNMCDSFLSSFFSQVKKTKTITTNENGIKQETV